MTPLRDGFDFLGFNFRLYPRLSHVTGLGLLTKPAKKNVQRFKDTVKAIFKKSKHWNAYQLIYKLNPIVRGWRNHFRHVVSKRVFTKLDWFLWHRFLLWACRKHPSLGKKEVLELYFRPTKTRKWVPFGILNGQELQLLIMSSTPIKRYYWLKLDRNPYLLQNAEYFAELKRKANHSAWDK